MNREGQVYDKAKYTHLVVRSFQGHDEEWWHDVMTLR